MAEPEILFDVDASKILAKLHLGALEACKQWRADGFFVNTGIKNDNPTATPDNPGKVEFDITNGQYEVGYVTDIDFEADSTLNATIEKISPLIAKIKVNPSDLKEAEPANNVDADKPLLSKDKNAQKQAQRDVRDEKIDSNVDTVYKKIDDLLNKSNKELVKNGFNKQKVIDDFKSTSDSFKKYLAKRNKNAKLKDKTAEDVKPEDVKISELKNNSTVFKDFAEFMIKSLQNAAMKSGNSTSLSNISNSDFTNAFSGLQAYMQVFVGDKAKALKEESVVRQFAPSSAKDSNDKSLVANFEIVPADEKEVELQQKQNEANKDKATMKVCFKIGYSVVIDK